MPGMDLPLRHPVERYAEVADVAACELADALEASGWTPGATEDAVHAIDTLTAALALLGPEVADLLAPVRPAMAALTAHLAPPGERSSPSASGSLPVPPPRRRGLGPRGRLTAVRDDTGP